VFDRQYTRGYSVFLRELVSWKRKKQSVVSRSSIESECRAMANTACELVCIRVTSWFALL